MSTFLQLCQQLRKEVGITGSGPATVVSQIGDYERVVQYIADADEHIQLMNSDWKFLHTTLSAKTLSSGTAEYSLSTLTITDLAQWDLSHSDDSGKTSFVLNPTGDSYQVLSFLDYSEWRARQKLGTVPSDTPTRIVVKPDNGLVFYPTPNAADTFVADYYKTPTRLSANSDISAIPSQFHRIIVLKGKMLQAEYIESQHLYQTAVAEFNDYLHRLEADQLPGQQYRTQSRVQQPIEVVAQ